MRGSRPNSSHAFGCQRPRTERVAKDSPGEGQKTGAQMQTEVDGSGYRIAYITRLSSENDKQKSKQNFGLVIDQD